MNTTDTHTLAALKAEWLDAIGESHDKTYAGGANHMLRVCSDALSPFIESEERKDREIKALVALAEYALSRDMVGGFVIPNDIAFNARAALRSRV